MSYPNGNPQHYIILPHAPPVLPNQNTPQETWREDRKMWKAYTEFDWFMKQQHEPGMPNNGKSILLQWLIEVEEGTKWECRVPLDVELSWCNHRPFGRVDRAIAHVRKHLDFKPFACEGRCENGECNLRFHSSEKLSAHLRGPDFRSCKLCGALELRQNMARHEAECTKKPCQVEEAT